MTAAELDRFETMLREVIELGDPFSLDRCGSRDERARAEAEEAEFAALAEKALAQLRKRVA